LERKDFTRNLTNHGDPQRKLFVSTPSDDAIGSFCFDNGTLVVVDSTCLVVRKDNKEYLNDVPLEKKEKMKKCFLCGSVLYIETGSRVFTLCLENLEIINTWDGYNSLKEFYDYKEKKFCYSTMDAANNVHILSNTDYEVISLSDKITFKIKDYYVGEDSVMFLTCDNHVKYFDRQVNEFTNTVKVPFQGNAILVKHDIAVVTGVYQLIIIDVKKERGTLHNTGGMKVQRCEFFNSSHEIYAIYGNYRDDLNLVQLDTQSPTHCTNLLSHPHLRNGKLNLCVDGSIIMHVNNVIMQFPCARSIQ